MLHRVLDVLGELGQLLAPLVILAVAFAVVDQAKRDSYQAGYQAAMEDCASEPGRCR